MEKKQLSYTVPRLRGLSTTTLRGSCGSGSSARYADFDMAYLCTAGTDVDGGAAPGCADGASNTDSRQSIYGCLAGTTVAADMDCVGGADFQISFDGCLVGSGAGAA